MVQDSECSISPAARQLWPDLPALAALLAVVAGIYFTRLTALPIRGEESRWARSAVQMIQTGDWIVPRQQGQPFLDRPPLGCWAIAVVGLVRGKVDLVAVRLPSVLAVLLTTLVVYAYARSFLGQAAALAAGTIYATMGQVLQIGRLGENDALFALLVSSALLTWHWARLRRWPLWLVWSTGYALAAMAALQKGLQGPAFFVAATGLYLLVSGQWRCLFSWQHLLGLAVLLAITGGWTVLFWRATDWQSTIAIWTQTVAYRFTHHASLAEWTEHFLTYPLATFGCMLPWSPLVLGLLSPEVRRTVGRRPPQIGFLLASLAGTYPSVWLAAAGKTRYFLSLYPIAAVLFAFLVERYAAAEPGTALRRAWQRYVVVVAPLMVIGAAVVLVASLGFVAPLDDVAQPVLFAALFAAAGCGAAVLLWQLRRLPGVGPAAVAIVAIAAFLGLAYTGAVVNARQRIANDMTAAVASLKQQLPSPDCLVSFGAINHRFAYYYETFIPQLPWPTRPDHVPEHVTYFCFDLHPGDTPQQRLDGRAWSWSTTPGTLPFRWEEIARLPTGRNRTSRLQTIVVVGRIIRGPEYLAGRGTSSIEDDHAPVVK